MKDGVNLEWVRSQTYPDKNWKWSATFTHDITMVDINILYLAPVRQKQ